MGELSIRPLTRGDRKLLTAMLRKYADKVGDSGILNIVRSGGKSEGGSDDSFMLLAGVNLLKLLLEVLENDVAAWFADLLGVTVDELDSMPLDIEVRVIEQIVARPEAADFFAGASRLVKQIRQLAGR